MPERARAQAENQSLCNETQILQNDILALLPCSLRSESLGPAYIQTLGITQRHASEESEAIGNQPSRGGWYQRLAETSEECY